MDTIERQAAIDAFRKHCEFDCYRREDNWCSGCQYEELKSVIENLPTAQLEIVGCEQCKYSGGATPIADGRYWCTLHCAFMSYCSDAEIKGDTE